MGVAAEGTKPTQFRLYRNGELTGTAFVDVNSTNSVCEKSVSGTLSSAGLLEFIIPVGKTGQENLHMRESDIHIWPGDKWTVTVTSEGAADYIISLRWHEEF